MSSTSSTASSVRALLTAALLAAGSGCATAPLTPELGTVAELTAVPFHPQTADDCGPAALATILNHAAVPVGPAELMDQVYVGGLGGSLQAELLAATRRYGRLPVRVGATPQSLLAAIADGRPVLVLQNLGWERAPVWHYAVVVGFDAETDRFVLRSGNQRRRLERSRRFLRRWALAGNWGFVAVRPGEVPADTTPRRYMRALVGSARQLGASSAAAAYDAALSRWDDDPFVLFLVAAHRHAEARLAEAAELYRRVLTVAPDHAAAHNNLANVLLAQGCRAEARREARLGLRLEGPDGEFHSELTDTLQRIEASPAAAAPAAACPAG